MRIIQNLKMFGSYVENTIFPGTEFLFHWNSEMSNKSELELWSKFGIPGDIGIGMYRQGLWEGALKLLSVAEEYAERVDQVLNKPEFEQHTNGVHAVLIYLREWCGKE